MLDAAATYRVLASDGSTVMRGVSRDFAERMIEAEPNYTMEIE